MRARFNDYESYASASFNESFTGKEISDAYVVKAEKFETSYIENTGRGKFVMHTLPLPVQFAPVFGISTGDYNADGLADILVAGNSYATEASTGRYDALKGTLLAGDGKGHFAADANSRGFKADKDVKGFATLFLRDSVPIILVGNNNSTMEAYRFSTSSRRVFSPELTDAYVLKKKKNGKIAKQEFYWGDNYLSQGSRKITVENDVVSITVHDQKGNTRNVRY
jgi:hypothetical protein